jgi:RimJ/RimL family protein N-acetyltransferase
MPPPPTARLQFRPWRDDDLPLARALFGDPRVTALVGGPFDDDQVRARLASEIATEREHGYQYWPIFLHAGEYVGCCGLQPRRERVLELGFYLRPEHWGHGYAGEAARAAIAYAFDVLAATALFAGHHPDNRSSRRTLESLGFHYTHDELYPPTGLVHPCYELICSPSDYRTGRTSA